MTLKQINLKQLVPIVIIFGLFGGGLLILGTILFTKARWIILIYSLVMVATMLALKFNKHIEINYLKSFITGVLTFILMSVVMYFFILIWVNPNNEIDLWGHVWRFLAIIGIAIASSAVLGMFFRK